MCLNFQISADPSCDMVGLLCSVPRLMGYAHVARGVRLDSKGGLRFESGSKDILGEGREVAEVITVSMQRLTPTA